MISVHCLIAVIFMLITMDFPQYLPLFLSVVLFILALFAASISPSFSCDFSITHNAQTACPIVCSLIFSIVVIALMIFCAVTTSPSSRIWLALNCFYVLFALTCEVRAFVLSALRYTHRWIDHTNFGTSCTIPRTSHPIICYQVFARRHSRFTVCCFWFLVSLWGFYCNIEITLAQTSINVFYIWSVWISRGQWREDWRRELNHQLFSIFCLLVDLWVIAAIWAILTLAATTESSLQVHTLIIAIR